MTNFRSPEFDLERGQRLRAKGYSWLSIANLLGVSREAVRCRLDPEYAALRQAGKIAAKGKREAREQGATTPDRKTIDRRGKFHFPGDIDQIQTRRDAERLLALIPSDTRGLTARLCGDPLPGRSALDRAKSSVREATP